MAQSSLTKCASARNPLVSVLLDEVTGVAYPCHPAEPGGRFSPIFVVNPALDAVIGELPDHPTRGGTRGRGREQRWCGKPDGKPRPATPGSGWVRFRVLLKQRG